MAEFLVTFIGINNKEAYQILGLPIGSDKEAVLRRFRYLTTQLISSGSYEDEKRLEMVVAAYDQLANLRMTSQNKSKQKGHRIPEEWETDEPATDRDWKGVFRNGEARSNGDAGTETKEQKKKAERRRNKKKRQKEKKKLEKLESQVLSQRGGEKKEEESSSEEEDEEEEEEEEEESQGLDPNSAFVAKTAARRHLQGGRAGERHPPRPPQQPPNPPPHRHPASKQQDGMDQGGEDAPPSSPLGQARQLAKRGNEAASVGQYVAAVKLFSDAMALYSEDPRFYGNRSFCFNQLGFHDRALEDAERAVSLAPHWAKGHYRRGTALRDIGRFVDAEAAFDEVLRRDETCREAHQEIRRVRVVRIMEMGFTETQAENAVTKYSNVQPALDALLAGEFQQATEDVFYSDDEEEFLKRPKVNNTKEKELKMNPQNPEGLTSLWVGNILPEVTETTLTQLFSKYGQVTSVRLLKDKYCAFVNYAKRGGAGQAMEELQGQVLCGQKLLIKFPDNPILPAAQNLIARKGNKTHKNTTTTTTASTTTTTLQPSTTNHNNSKSATNQNASTATTTHPTPTTVAGHMNGGVAGAGAGLDVMETQEKKQKGPVNGDECYFWRTTGCVFGETCKFRHVSSHKGVDRKPWQK